MARLKQQLTFLFLWTVNAAVLAAIGVLLQRPIVDTLSAYIGTGMALAALELALYRKLRDE